MRSCATTTVGLWLPLDERRGSRQTEQDRPDILKRREEWFDGQLDLDPGQLIFIDETWALTNMARRYGRAGRRAANDCGPACRTGTGKLPPSLPA